MWIELGIERPGNTQPSQNRIWINTDHVVRVEFIQEGNINVATVTTTKPGGSDRTIFRGDDAERLKLALINERTWKPLLEYEF
jgi:hypothetical protein